ncbi:MAG: glutamine--tRNA ligase, partial [Gemmatimonadota bacterium]|nr:glutamine--tRNA ligase [Gemmatimonadota bacterium]
PMAPRVMCVLEPLPVVVENFPEGEAEWLEGPYFPRDVEDPPADWPRARKLPFTRRLLIDREDFREDPPAGDRGLAPGREVRLRHAYFLRCEEVVRGEDGEVVELRCSYDPETRGGSAPDGRKPSGTIHWVSADESLGTEIRLYDRLFSVPDPTEGVDDFRENLNPDSLEVLEDARIEPSVADDPPETHYQFERVGYFRRDRHSRAVASVVGEDHAEEDARLAFNRTVTLRDSWANRDEERRTRSRESEAPEVVGVDTGRLERDRRRESSPELRRAFERLQEELGLPEDLADLLADSEETVAWFEAALVEGVEPVAVANWLVHEARGVADGDPESSRLEPEALGALVDLVESDAISRPVAKDLLARLVEGGGDPREIVEREGLGRLADDEAIRELVAEIVAGHPDEAERYREGQTGLAGFFVGRVMRATDNRADPQIVKTIVEETLT